MDPPALEYAGAMASETLRIDGYDYKIVKPLGPDRWVIRRFMGAYECRYGVATKGPPGEVPARWCWDERWKDLSGFSSRDVAESNDERSFVIEVIRDGEPLVAFKRPLPADFACSIAWWLFRGLADAHARGLAVGWFSPELLWIDDNGSLRILPHSIPFRRPDDGAAAPEVVAGDLPSAAGDVYALAELLETMAGRDLGLAAARAIDPASRPPARDVAERLRTPRGGCFGGARAYLSADPRFVNVYRRFTRAIELAHLPLPDLVDLAIEWLGGAAVELDPVGASGYANALRAWLADTVVDPPSPPDPRLVSLLGSVVNAARCVSGRSPPPPPKPQGEGRVFEPTDWWMESEFEWDHQRARRRGDRQPPEPEVIDLGGPIRGRSGVESVLHCMGSSMDRLGFGALAVRILDARLAR